MAQAYLFVHFREKTTPDGEQVYFGLSKDGFHWSNPRKIQLKYPSDRLRSWHLDVIHTCLLYTSPSPRDRG